MFQITEKNAQILNLTQLSSQLSEDLKKQEAKGTELEKSNSQLRDTIQDLIKKVNLDNMDKQEIVGELHKALGSFKDSMILEITYPYH